jgi:5'(3')-deoxyribonucleotidase
VRIALDIDNVGRDFTGDLTTQYLKDYPGDKKLILPITAWELDMFFPVGKQIYSYFNKKRPQEIFEYGHAYDGFTEFVTLLRNRGHKVVFATSQYPGTEKYTLLWIMHNHLLDNDGICFLADKTLLRCEILLDDGLHNLEAFQSAGGISVAFEQPWNESWKGLRVTGKTERERYSKFLELVGWRTTY